MQAPTPIPTPTSLTAPAPAGLLRWPRPPASTANPEPGSPSKPRPLQLLTRLAGDLERHVLGHLVLHDLVAYHDVGRRSAKVTVDHLERLTHLHMVSSNRSSSRVVASVATDAGADASPSASGIGACTVQHRRGRRLAATHCRSLRVVAIGHVRGDEKCSKCDACRNFRLRAELLALVVRNRATLERVDAIAGVGGGGVGGGGAGGGGSDNKDGGADVYGSTAVACTIAASCPRLRAPFYIGRGGGAKDGDDERRRRDAPPSAAATTRSRLLLAQLSAQARQIEEVRLGERDAASSPGSQFTAERATIVAYLAANPQLLRVRLAGHSCLAGASLTERNSRLTALTLDYRLVAPPPTPLVRERDRIETVAQLPYVVACRDLARVSGFLTQLRALTVAFDDYAGAAADAGGHGGVAEAEAASDALEDADDEDEGGGGGGGTDNGGAILPPSSARRRTAAIAVTRTLEWNLPRLATLFVLVRGCGRHALPRLRAPQLRSMHATGFTFESVAPVIGAARRLVEFSCYRTRRDHSAGSGNGGGGGGDGDDTNSAVGNGSSNGDGGDAAPLASVVVTSATSATSPPNPSREHWWDAAIRAAGPYLRAFHVDSGGQPNLGGQGRGRGRRHVTVNGRRLCAMADRWPRLESLILCPSKRQVRAAALWHLLRRCTHLDHCDLRGTSGPDDVSITPYIDQVRHDIARDLGAELAATGGTSIVAVAVAVAAVDDRKTFGDSADSDISDRDPAAADAAAAVAVVVATRLTGLFMYDVEPRFWDRVRLPALLGHSQSCSYDFDVASLLRACPNLNQFYGDFGENGSCSFPPPPPSPPLSLFSASPLVVPDKPAAKIKDDDTEGVHILADARGVLYLPQLAAWLPRVTRFRLSRDVPPWTLGLIASMLGSLPRLRHVTMRDRFEFQNGNGGGGGNGDNGGENLAPDASSCLDLAAAAVATKSRLARVTLSPLCGGRAQVDRLVRTIAKRVPECTIRWIPPDYDGEAAVA